MNGERTSRHPDPSEVPELEEREVLFNAYLDGDLSAEREREFDERLESDPEFREAYAEFAGVVGEVQNLPYEFAPDDFSSRVRDRIRIRSRGGFFAENPLGRQRAPYEVVAIVMIVIMASFYFFLGAETDRRIATDEEKHLEVPPAPSSADGDRR